MAVKKSRSSSPRDPAVLVTETLQNPPRELTTGTTFAGRYHIIEELGHGGMGRVYKVTDTELNEKIALKLIRAEAASDSGMIERFRNELKSARQVIHKNVCRMFDFGRSEGAPYITMEYVPGEDLKRLIRKIGQMPAGRTVAIARQIAEGLAEAHAHGIVHRDLKPQNIMVDEGGNVRIMDFGIARSLEGKGLTGAGIMIGTPEYMSPEQVEGKPVDARSDIYSLGVILYEMMTGRVPFEGETPFVIGVKHKSEPPRDPREFNPALPPALSRLILRCLEKDREKRFSSAAEFIAELRTVEQAMPTTEFAVPKTRPRTSKQVTVTINVKKILVPALAGIAVAAVALVLWLVILKKHVVPPVSSDKPMLAVLYFKNNTGSQEFDVWRRALPELIIAKLYQSRFLDVASDSRIYGVLRELNLTSAESYAPEDLKMVAGKTGATHILQGALTRAGTSFRINTTLEETSSGKVLTSEMVQGEGEASFHTMVDELGGKIKAGLQLTSREIAADIDVEVGKITSPSPDAYKLYAQGRAYHLAQDYKNSIALMEKAVSLDPEFSMAYLSMGAAYSNMGFRSRAIQARRKALEFAGRISDRERWLIEGSIAYMREETYGEAIAAFEKVLALYPDDPLANNGLGLVFGYIEEPEKSVSPYEICVRRPGAPLLSINNLASTYARLGRYDRAREVVERYIETAGDSARVRLLVADFYLLEGRYDQALAELDKAFTLDPSNRDIDYNSGMIAMLRGDFARAETDFRKQVEGAIQAGMPRTRSNLAALYMAMGKYEKALDQVSLASEQALKVGEPSWLGFFNFFAALAYEGAGRYAEALEAARASYRIAEANGDMTIMRFALQSQGMAYLGMMALPEARRTAGELKALVDRSMNKKSIREYQALQARIELADGNPARAVENAEAAVRSLPPQSASSNPDAHYWNTLAIVHEATGDLEKARKAYEGLQKLTRGRFYSGHLFALSFYRLGLIAEKKGDKAAARRNYERFLEIWKDADPGLTEPADARRRLAAL